MSKKYYIWKDPACAGVNIEWLELSGREFYSLLKLPENRSRRFVRLGADTDPDADTICLEATDEQYREWEREHNASKYLRRSGKAVQVLSLESPAPLSTEGDSLHDVTPDETVDVEKAALSHMAHERLEQALKELSAEDTKLLAELYLHGKNAAEIARDRGLHRSTVSRQVSTLLERLKKFF